VRDPDITSLVDRTRCRRVEHPTAAQDQIAGIHLVTGLSSLDEPRKVQTASARTARTALAHRL
jgi:hypothetical protein